MQGAWMRAARTLGLAAASLLVALLFGEGATRLLGVRAASLAERSASDRALWRYDSTKGWCHTPGDVTRCFYGGPDAGHVRINSLGFRGAELGPAAPGARIAVLGDSFAFGVGVDEEHLFTSQLERMLAARGHAAPVVNLGVSGYSTDQELILLEEQGPALRPGIVVLVMADNDFEGNALDFVYRRYYKPRFALSPSGELVRPKLPVPHAGSVRLWLGEHSLLWNLVRTRRSSLPSLQAALDALQPGLPTRSADDPLRLTAALVDALAGLCTSLGATLVVVNTGHRGERTGYFHALRPLLEARQILYEGLEQPLGEARAASPEKLWDFGDDTHWNVDAHRVAARTLAAFLGRHAYGSADPAARVR